MNEVLLKDSGVSTKFFKWLARCFWIDNRMRIYVHGNFLTCVSTARGNRSLAGGVFIIGVHSREIVNGHGKEMPCLFVKFYYCLMAREIVYVRVLVRKNVDSVFFEQSKYPQNQAPFHKHWGHFDYFPPCFFFSFFLFFSTKKVLHCN